ncbi:protein kinase [Ignicoccus islandicus DSM 13165]|uniref:tRNA N6-adenosine threonylcarbamoyltransferase n=1 Tax=Ignicoccus islandicus DSM 13165 TaxID=940295 RepID=A0A0U3E8Q5_9CREN|nr:KEOPS complex N(6)-L-threonylcarbamoyladenine synthase Kae1 [Ignicoccus islandicus]ALU11742.1 protein kinase [Ignicoccus islandicus DSM 13165]
MIVLGIESTAHTFGVGIATDRKPYILANVFHTYVPEKGGIHPREAARHHAEWAPKLLRQALDEARISIRDVDAIAYSAGPGLGPCLRTGAVVARALAAKYGMPLVPVNHSLAHIEIARLYTGFERPLSIYVSGGSTIIATPGHRRYSVYGETLDIGLGNLLDTFARETQLGPPFVKNGVHVVELCSEGAKEPYPLPYTVYGVDLSFSGLLTAALKAWQRGYRSEVCYGLWETAYDMVLEIAERALVHSKLEEVVLVGGVAGSKRLQEKTTLMVEEYGAQYKPIPYQYARDNGAMIAWTGLLLLKYGIRVKPLEALVYQRWRLDEVEVPWLD